MSNVRYRYIVHESAAVLAMRMLVLQLIIGLGSLIINGSLLSAATLQQVSSVTPSASLFRSFAASSIVLQALDAILIATFLLRWAQTAYVFTPKEIIVRDGLWHTERAVYRLSTVRELRVRQNLVGRLFNFGTIVFYSSLLHQEIRLKHIPDPHRYEKVVIHQKPLEAVA